MKCISLFVCFFIGLQTLNVPDYERLISNIESKVEIVDESKASFLSLKCRDVTNAIQNEKADLICRIEIQSQKKDKLESKYIQKKKSSRGRGGMLSKESIAVKSSESGIETFIANGRRRNIICDLLQDRKSVV